MSEMEAWWEERVLGEKVVLVILFAIGGAGLMFLFGWIVMLLWNWLMPEIFGLKTVSYWQAWGLLALSCCLFGRIGGSGTGSGGKSDRKRKKELRRYMREECEKEEDAGAEPAGEPRADQAAGDSR
jgi:hypothetical protein